MTQPQQPDTPRATGPAGPAARVLIVDDEAAILSAMKRIFRGEGYTVLTAQSGKEALAWLATEAVDVVISDMRMPEMDGAQLLEQVFTRWPDTKRILLTGYSDASATIAAINLGKIWRFIAKPWDDDDLRTCVRQAINHRNLLLENSRLSRLTADQNEQLKALNAGLEARVAERTAELEKANADLHQNFIATVRVFSSLIELREGRLAGHSRRVADLARQLAEQLGLDEAEQRNVLLAALLHDIGKVALPDKLIDKAFNALTPAERLEVMQHPLKGEQFLVGVPQLVQVARLIRHHHEAMDGSGYPDHLTGLSIPFGARILALANDYDALQTGSLALHPHSPREARAVIVQQRGKRYDPRVVDAFTDLCGEGERAKPAQLRPRNPVQTPARPTWHELTLDTTKLRDGMRLARDLRHNEHGYLLLAAGNFLDEAIIRQLREMESVEGHAITVHIRMDNK